MAIDRHERLGLRADPTQRLRLRTNNWPRGQLGSYDVLEVNPTQPPFPNYDFLAFIFLPGSAFAHVQRGS